MGKLFTLSSASGILTSLNSLSPCSTLRPYLPCPARWLLPPGRPLPYTGFSGSKKVPWNIMPISFPLIFSISFRCTGTRSRPLNMILPGNFLISPRKQVHYAVATVDLSDSPTTAKTSPLFISKFTFSRRERYPSFTYNLLTGFQVLTMFHHDDPSSLRSYAGQEYP